MDHSTPHSRHSDSIEQMAIARATAKIKAATTDFRDNTEEDFEILSDTNIDANAIVGDLENTKSAVAVQKQVCDRNTASHEEEKRNEITAKNEYRITHRRLQEPFVFYFRNYLIVAGFIALFDSLVVAAGLYDSGVGGAIIVWPIALGLSALNVALGAIAANFLAYAQRFNQPSLLLRKLSALSCLISVLAIVAINLLFILFRDNSEALLNQQWQNLLASEIQPMSWFFFGVGLVIAFIAAWHWAHSHDPHRLYGQIGANIVEKEGLLRGNKEAFVQQTELLQTAFHIKCDDESIKAHDDYADALLASQNIQSELDDLKITRTQIIAEGNAELATNRHLRRITHESNSLVPAYLSHEPSIEQDIPEMLDVSELMAHLKQQATNLAELDLAISTAKKDLADYINQIIEEANEPLTPEPLPQNITPLTISEPELKEKFNAA